MAERITGSFPGGPRRSDEGDTLRRAPRLRTVEEIEAARSERTLTRSRIRRERTRLLGLLFAMMLGFAAGVALGVATHTTPRELTDALDSSRVRDAEISREVNRVLLELWKMEAVEAVRGRSPLP